jgi:hypothetical protein
MVERLDEERLEILRGWGSGLSTNARDELRAAGKAIVMLVEEIDHLQADVWTARAVANETPRAEKQDAPATTLRERLARGRVSTEPAA